jgi:HK97 family phage prohead protease
MNEHGDMTARSDASEDGLVCRSLVVRAIREGDREVDVVASTDDVDSYGDVVEQTWNLDRYNANPVVLYNHSRYGDTLPIGTARNVGVSDGALRATVRFASAEANPQAERVWQLVREKVLRAVSVGFMPGDVRQEMRDGRDIYVLANNDLHEISVVPVPANPKALARMRARALPSVTRGTAANTTPTEGITMSEKTVSKMLTAAATLGLPADSEERAEAAIVARASQMGDVCKALGLHHTSTPVEVSAKLAELSTAAASLPKIEAECKALRADKEARETAERAGHVDALIEATPALKSARAALEAFALADYAAFCKSYPKPANTARERSLTSEITPHGGAPEESMFTPRAPTKSASEDMLDAADRIAREFMAKDKSLSYSAAFKKAGIAIRDARAAARS